MAGVRTESGSDRIKLPAQIGRCEFFSHCVLARSLPLSVLIRQKRSGEASHNLAAEDPPSHKRV